MIFKELLTGNGLISLIRTYTPVWVGSALVLLQGWLDDHHILWIKVDSPSASVWATGAVISVYYFLARLAEKKWPKLGGILLGKKTQPVYEPPAPTIGPPPQG